MVFTLLVGAARRVRLRALSLPRQERPQPADDAAAHRARGGERARLLQLPEPRCVSSAPHAGMIIAHSVLSIPVAFLVIAAALKGFDRNLERAAMSAGAGPAAHLSLGDAAGAAARHPGRRAVRLPALVQRGGGGDLHRRPRRLDPAEEDVRIDPPRIRSRHRRGLDAAHRRGAARRPRLPVLPSKNRQGPQMQLDPLVKPRSVAIVGATDRAGPGAPSSSRSARIGFTGAIYPVNPKYQTRAQSRLLSEPDRPAGSARRGRVQHPQSADPRAGAACGEARRARRRDLRQPASPSSARTARGCRTRSPGCAARPAWRCAGRTAWASSTRRRA